VRSVEGKDSKQGAGGAMSPGAFPKEVAGLLWYVKFKKTLNKGKMFRNFRRQGIALATKTDLLPESSPRRKKTPPGSCVLMVKRKRSKERRKHQDSPRELFGKTRRGEDVQRGEWDEGNESG